MGSKTHTTTEKLWDELQNASQYNLPDDYEVDGQLSMFDNEYAKYTPNEYLSEEQKKMKSDDNYKAVLDNEADEEEKIFPISEDMQEYIKILEKVNVMCRSKTSKKQNCFTDNTRLHKIEDLTQHTPFSKIYDGNLTNIYGKKDLDDLPQDLFIVSTHVDTVNNISKCSSQYDKNTGNLRGTYDNAGTNAACVIAMRKFDLPDNVIFAFNGDEETGKCKGAEEVLTVMKEHNKKIFPIALDVTYDSYDDKKLYTIENFYGNIKTAELVINRARDLDSNLDNPTFTYVKAPNGPLPKLDKNEVSRDRSWFDEGAYYGEKRISAFSLCLPCGEGEMHSNYGVQVKAPVFEGYVNSLVGMLYEITKDKSNELEALKETRQRIMDDLDNYKDYQPRKIMSNSHNTYNDGYYWNQINNNYSELDTGNYNHSFKYPYQEQYNNYVGTDEGYGIDDETIPLDEQFFDWLVVQTSDYEAEDYALFHDELNIPDKFLDLFISDRESGMTEDERVDLEEFIADAFNTQMELNNCFYRDYGDYNDGYEY